MKARFVGLHKIEFVNDKNEEIKGVTLYFAYPEEGVLGMTGGKAFLKEIVAIPKDLKLMDEINIEFNHKGKAISIEKA